MRKIKVVPEYPKDFGEIFGSIPNRCDACGAIIDPRDDTSPDAIIPLFRCSNHHIFCEMDTIPLGTIPIETIRKYYQSHFPKQYAKIMQLNDEDFINSILAEYHIVLTGTNIPEHKSPDFDEFIDYFEPESVKVNPLVPWFFCPLCTFYAIKAKDILPILLKKYQLTKEQCIQEIRAKFHNYMELANDIWENVT